MTMLACVGYFIANILYEPEMKAKKLHRIGARAVDN